MPTPQESLECDKKYYILLLGVITERMTTADVPKTERLATIHYLRAATDRMISVMEATVNHQTFE